MGNINITTNLQMVEYTINRLENLITIIERDKQVIDNKMLEYKRIRGVNQFNVNQRLFDDDLNNLQRKIRKLILDLEKNKNLIEIYEKAYNDNYHFTYNSVLATFPISVPALLQSHPYGWYTAQEQMERGRNNNTYDTPVPKPSDSSSSGGSSSGGYTPSSNTDYNYKPTPVYGGESKPGNIYNGDSKTIAPEQEIPNNDNVEPTPYTPPVDNNSNNNYYWSGGESSPQEVVPEVPKEEPVIEQVDEIVSGNKYTKIPTATISKVATTTTTKSGNSVIPVLAGISAAAAAGIGAKAYMDRKKNSDNSDSDIEVSEWSEEYTDSDADSTPVESYSATSKNNSFVENDENSLSEDNFYEELEPSAEKYDARNNSDLSDMQ